MKKLYFVMRSATTSLPIKEQVAKYFSHTAQKLQIVNDHNVWEIDRFYWNFYSNFSEIECLISHPDFNKCLFQVLEFNVNQNDLIAFLCCKAPLVPLVAKYYVYDHGNKKIKLITEEMF